MSHKLLFLAATFLLFVSASAQTTPLPSPTADDEKLEKKAVEFLRETSAEVGRMRTMENRISFNAELASLMWFHDEQEAKQMYGGVVSDFKQFMWQLDAQMNTPVDPDEEAATGGIFGGYGKSKAERKFRIALEVRKQIAMSLAEHAPDLAYNFYFDSLNLISNEVLRKETEQSDKYFEQQLLQQIAESDAKKAVEYGKESIKGGLRPGHIDLLKKIYAKDTDKGIEFGAAILSRLKSGDAAAENLYFYSSLLTYGASNLEASKKPGGKKPIYVLSDLRDIAELYAKFILDANGSIDADQILSRVEQIEKYAPGRGSQIRAKYRKAGKYNV